MPKESRYSPFRLSSSSPLHSALLRLHTSLTYLLSTYLPPHLHTPLNILLTPRFTPLTTHLSALAALKAEAALPVQGAGWKY